jgi:hypothetical protein
MAPASNRIVTDYEFEFRARTKSLHAHKLIVWHMLNTRGGH